MNLEKENVRMACLKPKDKLEFKFSPSPPTHVVFGMYRVKTKLIVYNCKRQKQDVITCLWICGHCSCQADS